MKKLVAIAVLCVASICCAQVDLVATMPGGGGTNTILTNTGSEAIDIEALSFTDADGMITATSLWFPILTTTVATPYELTAIDVGAYVSLPAGESVDLGILTGGNESIWQKTFEIIGGQTYLSSFELIPEPASMGLLALGVLAVIRRRC